MPITAKERDAILRLRNEGKMCSKILSDDFPNFDYGEIMGVIYGTGIKTAIGTKKAIANRCKKITKTDNQQAREILAREINDLAWQLYEMIKDNQKRLEEVRRLTSIQKSK